MRHEIEGTGLPQAQLLWRKVRGAQRAGRGGSLSALTPAPHACGLE